MPGTSSFQFFLRESTCLAGCVGLPFPVAKGNWRIMHSLHVSLSGQDRVPSGDNKCLVRHALSSWHFWGSLCLPGPWRYCPLQPPTILQGTALSHVMDSETEAQSSCGASLSELGHGEARPDPGQPDLAVCKAPQAEGVYVQGLWTGQSGSVLDSPRIPSRGNAGQQQAVKSK